MQVVYEDNHIIIVSKRSGEIVYNYDRGLNVAPVDENTAFALKTLLHSENR